MSRVAGGGQSEGCRELFDIIVGYHLRGEPVSAADLARDTGRRHTSITRMFERLVRDEAIEVRQGTRQGTRLVTLTEKGLRLSGLAGYPVYGCIRAGIPEEATQADEVDFIELPPALARKLFGSYEKGDFGLRVNGDSMAPEILPGDLVVVRPHVPPKSGDVVAVYAGDDYCATLKRWEFELGGASVRLVAVNPAYPVLESLTTSLTVAGVVKGLSRGYGK
jgi:SOS-response transcriptional repressor LexA